MTGRGRPKNLAPLGRLFEVGVIGTLTDRELLEMFAVRTGEEAELAFSVLVGRHGGAVLRACRGVLGNEEDSLDAFQATFLVLARKAATLWVGHSLAPWLNRVARRTSLRAKRSAARRGSVERDASKSAHTLPGDCDRAQFWSVVHEEVERLPARYRLPVVLCDLEGRSYEEAAHHLGCPIGTVKSRLARGRERLRSRLIGRGFGPSLLTGVPLCSPGAREAMTPRLADLVSRGAAGYLAAGVAATHRPAVLAEGVLTMMKINRFAVAAAALVVIVFGSATLGARALSDDVRSAGRSGPAAMARPEGPRPEDLASIRARLERDWASLATLEFTAEERFRDPDASRAFASYRTEFSLGTRDRRTVSVTFFGPDGVPALRDEVRSDGKTTYHLLSERGKPDAVRQVTIDDQTDRRDRYAGVMCDPLWLWTPAGRPLSAHLASGGKLVVERDDKGSERVILVTESALEGGGEVRCELDGDHGWAARRVELPGHWNWEVKRFMLVDGRWFPAEGRCTQLDAPAGPNASTEFKVTRWHVNRPILAARFELPKLPQGVPVFDQRQLIDGVR